MKTSGFQNKKLIQRSNSYNGKMPTHKAHHERPKLLESELSNIIIIPKDQNSCKDIKAPESMKNKFRSRQRNTNLFGSHDKVLESMRCMSITNSQQVYQSKHPQQPQSNTLSNSPRSGRRSQLPEYDNLISRNQKLSVSKPMNKSKTNNRYKKPATNYLSALEHRRIVSKDKHSECELNPDSSKHQNSHSKGSFFRLK